MLVDKDKPSTWTKHKESECTKCIGTCCTMPVEVKVEDLVRLEAISDDDLHISRRKLVNRLKKDGLITSFREGTQLFTLTQKANGDCYFLNSQTRLCTIYQKRPGVCREFPKTLSLRPGFCPKIAKA